MQIAPQILPLPSSLSSSRERQTTRCRKTASSYYNWAKELLILLLLYSILYTAFPCVRVPIRINLLECAWMTSNSGLLSRVAHLEWERGSSVVFRPLRFEFDKRADEVETCHFLHSFPLYSYHTVWRKLGIFLFSLLSRWLCWIWRRWHLSLKKAYFAIVDDASFLAFPPFKVAWLHARQPPPPLFPPFSSLIWPPAQSCQSPRAYTDSPLSFKLFSAIICKIHIKEAQRNAS